MKKALVVGVDSYQYQNRLNGCVNDAYQVSNVLSRHGDGTKNFDVNLVVSTSPDTHLSRKDLKDKVTELFRDKSDIALFYFSGHGYVESTGGYLCPSDCQIGDDGLPMNDIMTILSTSLATNKIIILDCCHSGKIGSSTSNQYQSILTEGTTILTASGAEQYAVEENGSGIFTSLLIDAMNGSASNLVGEITPGSIYAHIDQSLGAWEQRPIFKSNVRTFTSLRKVASPIFLEDLKRITELFPQLGQDFNLDPSFEPTSSEANEENVAKFKILQKFRSVNLVVPIDSEHLYFAAMDSKACKLTILGEHYWKLVKKDRI